MQTWIRSSIQAGLSLWIALPQSWKASQVVLENVNSPFHIFAYLQFRSFVILLQINHPYSIFSPPFSLKRVMQVQELKDLISATTIGTWTKLLTLRSSGMKEISCFQVLSRELLACNLIELMSYLTKLGVCVCVTQDICCNMECGR